MNSEINKIGIIGLGYVGLPLLVSFSKHFEVIGYDINKDRIHDLQKGIDRTLEISDPNLLLNQNIQYTYEQNNLETCDVYIITVPTPVDDYKVPDLSYLKEASKLVSKYLKKNNLDHDSVLKKEKRFYRKRIISMAKDILFNNNSSEENSLVFFSSS